MTVALRWAPALVLALAFVGAALATGSAKAADDERARLLARQDELGAQFDAEDRACRARFVVTACVDDVQQRRRAALAPLRERLMALDEADRARRAATRREELAERVRQRSERLAAAQAAAAAASSASTARPRQRMLPPVAPQPASAAAADPAGSSARETQAQQRQQQARQRQAEAADRQARVARRLAEREAAQKKAVPLPPAAGASAPR